MSEERRKILEMLNEGKVDVDEAERLLSALGEVGAEDRPLVKGVPKYLRVAVESAKGDNVNVRVPMQLIRAGMKFSAFMNFIPEHAREHISAKLGDKGIDFDFGKMKPEDIEELIQALAELEVNVDSEGGDKVRVFTE